MKEFSYTIQDRLGIHARPAGELNKLVKDYASVIKIHKGEKSAEFKRILQLMGLGVKCGEIVKVTFDGADEEKAYEEVKAYFEKNL